MVAVFFWFGAPDGPAWPWSVWISVLLAGVALVYAWRNPVVPRLAFGFAALLLFHSLLPYKTPWLILQPLLPLTLLAGVGASVLPFAKSWRIAAVGIALVLMFTETWVRSLRSADNITDAMAYSPTHPATAELVRQVDAFAASNPKGRELVVQVVTKDYWPLPWLLRKFPNIGFWSARPESWPGDIIICESSILPTIPGLQKWQFTEYLIRPGVSVFVGVPRKP